MTNKGRTDYGAQAKRKATEQSGTHISEHEKLQHNS